MKFFLIGLSLMATVSVQAAEVCTARLSSAKFLNMFCTSEIVDIQKETDDMTVIKIMKENGYDLKTRRDDSEKFGRFYLLFVKP